MLREALIKIDNLNDDTHLKITCVDGQIVTGYFRCYTSAIDNEPEIAQIDICVGKQWIGLLETEIKEIVEIE